jgi:hypothetical protein
MKLVAAVIAALSLISTTYAQGQHTYNGRKPEPMQTTNDIRMVAPALSRKLIEDSIKLLQLTAGRCAGEVASAKVNGVIRFRELSPSPLG